jgi:hypothetical protein
MVRNDGTPVWNSHKKIIYIHKCSVKKEVACLLVRKDMDVNEREWLSKTLKTQIQVKEQHFIAVLSPRDEIFIVLDMCSAFHSHSRVFNNEINSYPKMSVKWPRNLHLSSYSLHLLINATSVHLHRLDFFGVVKCQMRNFSSTVQSETYHDKSRW